MIKSFFTAVMTHKEALPIVKRHYWLWNKFASDLIFISPKDSLMEDLSLNEIAIGYAQHDGEISAQRIISIFEELKKFKWEYLILNEYDSFILDLNEEIMPPEGGMTAGIQKQNKPKKFKGKFYPQFPMIFIRKGFEKVLEKLNEVEGNDRLFSDRFIGVAIEKANIPIINLFKLKKAYSKNTINLKKHKLELKEAKKNGVLFWHGVKSEDVYNFIIKND